MPVLDASVVTALFRAYDDHYVRARTWALTSRSAGELWYIPSLALAEVSATLGQETGGPALARRFVEDFSKVEILRIIDVTRDLAIHAATIASEFGIRGCDSVYVALAVELNESLVTFDRQQALRGASVAHTTIPE